jgi:hypothetical protein
MLEQIITYPSRHYYDRDTEQHVLEIDRLVHELRIPAEEVNRAYREILEEMKRDKSAKAFLPSLVSIGVKIRLRDLC